ncbi:PilZ domain-containing protein [Pseudomonas aeruginosa]|uniref:PilZ domain-containing protein n=2 Tax=Pseudomonas aeruginosa TaxID=287 RepID=UPI0023DCFCC0|nr:PilZ domain-containing protein [Pseudomonas aeruginosa]
MNFDDNRQDCQSPFHPDHEDQPIEHNYSEKRDFIRMKLDTPVTIRCEGRESVALCRDLSASGLLLEAQSELAPGDHLRVSIPSTHETLTGLELEARVVRCERLGPGRQSLGLSIVAIH